MKKFGSVFLLLLVAGFVYMLYDYLSYRHQNAVSDAAFVKSDAIYTLGFKVGGKIDHIHYVEGQKIVKDTILATIDPSDFILQEEALSHAIKAIEAKKEALIQKKIRVFKELGIKSDISKNNIGVSDEKLHSLRLKLNAAKTKLKKVAKDHIRFTSLLKQKLISKADFEKIDTKYKVLKDQIDAAKKELSSAQKSTKNVTSVYHISELEKAQIKEIELSINALDEQIASNQKKLESLKNKTLYCSLRSPINGIVAKRFVNQGRVVAKGTPIYSIVDTHNKHVEVLLSEKKLEGIHPKNPVTITTQAMGGKELKGEVESISPTSASTFSLVPRDIASGEFTKLDQRFIVRIKFDEPSDVLKHVYIGMGATVAIERKEN